MIAPRTAYIITISIVILVLVLVLAYYIFYKKILADSIYGQEQNRVTKQIDLDNDGFSDEIILFEFKKNNSNIFMLGYKSKSQDSYLELNGFESIADFCPDPFPKINSSTQIICVSGFVGAHSANIELIKLIDYKLVPINFNKDGSKITNISSDAPMFGFEDVNHNGELTFFIDDRNYDLDPTLDSWRSYYYFKDGEFNFDHTISLRDGIKNLNQEGKIN
jgi:hypothetical protein